MWSPLKMAPFKRLPLEMQALEALDPYLYENVWCIFVFASHALAPQTADDDRARRAWHGIKPIAGKYDTVEDMYLREGLDSIPWSKKGFQHVFVPDPSTANPTEIETSSFSQKEQDEIILSISIALTLPNEPRLTSEPVVHFKGTTVYVSNLNLMSLFCLLVTPPTVRYNQMKLVEKGLPFVNPHVKKYENMEAMKFEDFEEGILEQYTRRKAMRQKVCSISMQAPTRLSGRAKVLYFLVM